MDFKELMFAAGMTISETSIYLDVSERTILRWCKSGAPLVAIRALNWCAGYNENWKGFCFQKSKLTTPSGHVLRPVDIDQIQWFNRMHYSNGMDRAEARLKEKTSQQMDISKVALAYLKKEITATMENFDWSAERYFNGAIDISIAKK
jgi:hypothetical protein